MKLRVTKKSIFLILFVTTVIILSFCFWIEYLYLVCFVLAVIISYLWNYFFDKTQKNKDLFDFLLSKTELSSPQYWEKVIRAIMLGVIVAIFVKIVIPDKTNEKLDKIITVLEERGVNEEKTKEFLIKILGPNYQEILEDPESFNGLMTRLENRNLGEILQEMSLLQENQIDRISKPFRDKIYALIGKFRFKSANTEIDSFRKKYPNLSSRELVEIHFLKALIFLLEDSQEKAEYHAEIAVSLTDELMIKGLIISRISDLGQPLLANRLVGTILQNLEDEDIENDSNAGALLMSFAEVSISAGNIKGGLLFAQESHRLNLQNYRVGNKNILLSMFMIGKIYGMNRDFTKSNTLLPAVLEYYKEYSISDEVLLGEIYRTIGLNHFEQEEYHSALYNLQISRDILERGKKTDANTFYGLYISLAMTNDGLGNSREAIENYWKAKRYISPSNKLLLGQYYLNLGTHYKVNNEFKLSKEYYEKSYRLMNTVLPQNHPLIQRAKFVLNELSKGMDSDTN